MHFDLIGLSNVFDINNLERMEWTNNQIHNLEIKVVLLLRRKRSELQNKC